MLDFSQRIRHLHVSVGPAAGGDLRRESQFVFTCADTAARPISLIMPMDAMAAVMADPARKKRFDRRMLQPLIEEWRASMAVYRPSPVSS